MSYALFDGDQKLSQNYLTEQEAWQHAEDADLIETVGKERFLADGSRSRPASPMTHRHPAARDLTRSSRVLWPKTRSNDGRCGPLGVDRELREILCDSQLDELAPQNSDLNSIKRVFSRSKDKGKGQ